MSVSLGAEDKEEANVYFTQAVLLSLAAGAVIALLGTLFLPVIIRLLGGSGLDAAADYMRPVILAAPVFIIAPVLSLLIRSDADPFLSTLGVTVSSSLNIALDFVFIVVMRLGMFGASLAVVLAQLSAVVIFSLYFFKKQNHLKLRFRSFHTKNVPALLQGGVGIASSYVYQFFALIVINNILSLKKVFMLAAVTFYPGKTKMWVTAIQELVNDLHDIWTPIPVLLPVHPFPYPFQLLVVRFYQTIFLLVYIAQIFTYSLGLALPALTVILISCIITLVTTLMSIKYTKKEMLLSSKQSGMQYALITGVQKIRLSGAEKRVFGRWANTYTEIARLKYDPPALLKYSSVLSTAVSSFGTLAIYYFAVKTNVGIAGYMAFNVSFGMVSGAFAALFGMVTTIAGIKPTLDMALPLIIDNLSLRIRPGQYVAIVGQTGCGKSTLMRLLLGFETPIKGALYYDNKDLSKLDLRSLRRNIGVVMQNGKLMQGDIYSNIIIIMNDIQLQK